AVAEETRGDEVEQRPQFAQVVLQRRAGEAHALPSLQAAHQFRRIGGGVLDILRLVEDGDVPFLRHQRLVVARQQRIGGYYKIVFADFGKVFLPRRSVQGEDLQ